MLFSLRIGDVGSRLIAMVDNIDELIPTRRSLLSRLKNWNDQESWKVFFDTYWKLIYHTAIKAGLSDAEAQDVVQETVISVLKGMPDFKYETQLGSFKGWLLKLTGWRIKDQLRKRQRSIDERKRDCDTSTRTPTVERLPDPAGFALDSIWDDEWEKNLVDVAIARVKRKADARQFQIFDLYVLKKWPVTRVARTLKVSVGRVYLAKHRLSGLIKKEITRLRSKPV